MQQAVQSVRTRKSSPGQFSSRRLPWLRFFRRYPIFLLAFGPPLFRALDKYAGTDTSQTHFDIWTIIQVGLLGVVALRALLRLSTAHSIRLTAPVRSVIKYALFLGLLFSISIIWSPGRAVSSAFNLICVAEFLVDTYRRPPDWMQCLFAMRLVSLLLMLLVAIAIVVAPYLVLGGMRLTGGSIGNVHVICPFIAIVSTYSYLYSIEPRRRSATWFFVGLIGTALTRTRGAEIALCVALCILGFIWARRNLRSAYFFTTVAVLASLLVSLIFFTGNSGQVWQKFNRGGDTQNIMSLSGRTDTWVEVISYCLQHPQGMGYIAGLRASHFTAGSEDPVMNKMGGTDNSYFETLADGGWLGLALYLLILIKVFHMGWRHLRNRARDGQDVEALCRHAIFCSLLLLTFCLIDGMDGSEFALPMQQPFYFQWITLTILMGAVSTITLTRRRHRHERLRAAAPAMRSLPHSY
jgi:O-Antigen ligase